MTASAPTPAPTPLPADAARVVRLEGPGVSAAVDLGGAVLRDPAGRPVLTPLAAPVARWDLLDRSPLSARWAGVDAGGRAVAWCRYEVVDGGVRAEVRGGGFTEQPGAAVFIPAGG